MIKKVKDWLGIEGVTIKLEVPETFRLNDGELHGSFTISSQSDQFIESVRLTFTEKYFRGRRKSKLIDEYILAEELELIGQNINNEQVIRKDFKIQFNPLLSPMDKFGDKNLIFRGFMNVAKLIKNAKSQFSLTIEAQVKGNKLKPYDKTILVAE